MPSALCQGKSRVAAPSVLHQIHCAKSVVLSALCQVHCAKCIVPCAKCIVPSALFQVHCAQVHCAKCVPSPCSVPSALFQACAKCIAQKGIMPKGIRSSALCCVCQLQYSAKCIAQVLCQVHCAKGHRAKRLVPSALRQLCCAECIVSRPLRANAPSTRSVLS